MSALQLPAIEPITAGSEAGALARALQAKIDGKTKPLGALGQLEALALQLGLIQRSQSIAWLQPQMVVFAADHGIVDEGVSAFPQAVTAHMVANMLGGEGAWGGAAVNVLARQHGFALTVVDAGVCTDLPDHPNLLHRKVARGSANCVLTKAMTPEQALQAVTCGQQVLQQLPGNVVAFGEMGIGNTSSAALMLALLSTTPVEACAGRGTGLDDTQMQRKLHALRRAQARHGDAHEPLAVLAAVGGFEIAMMLGAMLQAASQRRVILVDGFIAGAAALAAVRLVPAARDYMVFAHCSAERGHRAMLKALGAQPLLDLGLRLGEGSGALLAWPLVASSACLLNEMASFAQAGVAQRV